MKISNTTTSSGFESSVCYNTFDSPWSSGTFFSHHHPLHSPASLLLLQMFLILSLRGLLRLILRPLSQPAIISDVLAGIIIGPSGLGRYPLFKKVFPPQAWTVTRILGIIGVLFHIFNEALKEDLHYVLSSGRKEVIISVSGYFVSNFSTFVVGRSLMHFGYLPKNINRMHLLDSLSGFLALTSFPVLRPILSEFNLTTSQLGRLSMTLAVINTLLGTTLSIVYSSIRHVRMHPEAPEVGVYHFAAHVAMFILLLTLVRPLMLWFIKKAKEGRRMPSIFVNLSMLVVLLTGMLSDMLGTVLRAPIWLALMIPTGPPLASALIGKTEVVCRMLLVPFFFAANGQHFNSWAVLIGDGWQTFWCLQLFFFTACLGKILGTILPALYFKMHFQDSLALSIAMCVKGIFELVIFTDWLNLNMLNASQLVSLELSLLGGTAIATPCLRMLARQRPRRWSSNHWRCISQSDQPDTEFGLLACIHDRGDVPTVLHLAKSNIYLSTKKTPTQLFILHLVNRIGHGIPMLIRHKESNHSLRPSMVEKLDPIFSSFLKLERHSRGGVVLCPFTSVSLYKAMHEDVCRVALDNKVSLVILPFWKHTLTYSTTRINVGSDHGWQGRNIVVRKVLEEAPCSVGVLVDNDCSRTSCLVGSFRIGLVFLGGPDDREALAYASLMVDNPGVKVTLLRCNLLSDRDEGFNVERVLDDECIGEFRLKTCSHEGTVYDKEAFATSVEELVSSIRGIGTDFNLMMTGRRHSCHPEVEVALSSWRETEELGVIGDFLSSSDFAKNSVPVLVIQQRSMVPLWAIHGNNIGSNRQSKLMMKNLNDTLFL
ncbi:hypothetical protein H6P81_007374 [Aristolochia fimbriata]|uniref:Cation/H+ exchanger domain-containing protein n=1 Tax=Aristolochia fimbriata TaxID=158543 RepID=A0AAV7F022_ARIFI|nr:hypothetical protein H6P81_007374 [Aristolochia fimbriata]